MEVGRQLGCEQRGNERRQFDPDRTTQPYRPSGDISRRTLVIVMARRGNLLNPKPIRIASTAVLARRGRRGKRCRGCGPIAVEQAEGRADIGGHDAQNHTHRHESHRQPQVKCVFLSRAAQVALARSRHVTNAWSPRVKSRVVVPTDVGFTTEAAALSRGGLAI